MSKRFLFACVVCGLLVAALPMQARAGSGDLMVPASAVPEPDEGHATVTFLRPSKMAFAIKFGIWDGEKLVGVLTATKSITVQVEPGEHVFLGKAENWDVVKANLTAGKHYFILARARAGIGRAGVNLIPVTADTAEAELAKWRKKAKPIQVDPAHEAEYVAKRLEDVRKALQNVADGKAKFSELGPDDYRE